MTDLSKSVQKPVEDPKTTPNQVMTPLKIDRVQMDLKTGVLHICCEPKTPTVKHGGGRAMLLQDQDEVTTLSWRLRENQI